MTPIADPSPAQKEDETGTPALTQPPAHLQWTHTIPGPLRAWWIGVAVAAVFALPLAWLLSYAAALPFFLGLFFFMLFGLLIGAVAFRVASASKPYANMPVIFGTTMLVGVTWGVSLYKEARDFPDDLARRVSLRTRDIGPGTVKEFRATLASQIRVFLGDRYGPGPTWGYIRWVLTNGRIHRGEIPLLEKGVSVPVAQTRGWWAFRVVASATLLSFGIASQTLLLRAGRGTETLRDG